MIITEKTPVQTHRERQIAIQCDLCSAKSPQPETWSKGRFDIVTIRIEIKTGFSAPEGGYMETRAIDICPTCRDGKLIPWLSSLGVTGEVIEAEW